MLSYQFQILEYTYLGAQFSDLRFMSRKELTVGSNMFMGKRVIVITIFSCKSWKPFRVLRPLRLSHRTLTVH